ncbi:uncharacterized protein OCT59_003899 [Rhizophagus irregularis]|uniref:F-box domain-containing protein n=2 Tax=Rhizophagus irregularis (strain DAOM 181602 / DAOM 197198 / MUCL 43194) TaxID=747089 RepID=A0A2H5SD40_RHIID|nr:hypothetical protein GLOIN_2v1767079 [Rhizophagus irregularis DAOM 181602=DAOM 197198]POG78012.1 hypothetical protein GLOIN_2v1767079 [Rhizophagus irregularis DAOM 181602=DAOM 197198]UZO12360.1 hypothetical protein OCT59_003899 [Rhizophagus irregularis]GET60754.1 hypothetical protein GLOIN_2v1767079 [Rhizophagus irregularis DAOM 181602=DAOM 197198]CAB5177587.1 unnamed protein product [Rhizophagus irregularis]|eukprot:XP_025184878.1 hypothetical protein GLOIN_2v1767079 [Rhizophagus irregularis DAOM 181602=DAOM 197198]
MACSKILSGDLPELLNDIIQYFYDDFSTLHSCVLVNRLWCRLAIPLLWEDPFSIPTQNYNCIEIYLHNLNDYDKKDVNKYENNNFFSSNTLFNYPSLIKCLNTHKIVNAIEEWVAAPIEKRSIYYYSTSPTLIYKLLLKVFVENKARLNAFEIILNRVIDFQCFNESFEFLLQNPNFIRNIKILKLEKVSNLTKIYSLLKFLYSNCNSISTIFFQFQKNFNDKLIEKYSSQIIYAQKNLKKVLFDFNEFPLYYSLLSLKNSNCLNTLKTIIFHNVNFSNIVGLNEVFEQLNVLDSIHILYCLSLNSDFIQQIIKITKPFKLKSLFINELEIFQIETLQYLLQKSGNYLENIGLISSEFNQKQLFEIILKYCTRIRFFDLPGFCDQNIHLAFKLIENAENNLNYLSLDIYNQLVLQGLGQLLPVKLEYLNLSIMTSTSNFKIFLKSSQRTFIKKLLIRNEMQVGSEDILPYIKEYIMKEKRVKYLAIKEDFAEESRDLLFLRDEVKMFESYGIKVQNYCDLRIQIYNFINKMY